MKISVIIATYNRKESLARTLYALEDQNFSSNDFEVIVVDDGSADGTADLISSLVEQYPSQLILLRQHNQGPATARNLGLRQASGEIVAFTDDDCIPDENWLAAIDEFFKDHTVVAVQGRTYTDLKSVTPRTHQIHNLMGNKDVPTCNAAYTRVVLEAVNGFDEHFPFPHNEDADLAWRVAKLGTIGFCRGMLVYHPPRVDKFSKVARRMRILLSEFRLFHKDPDSYRANRSTSSWKNIYWEVGIKTQWYYFKNRFRHIHRPALMFQGLALSMIWAFDLLVCLPRFIAEDQYNNSLFRRKSGRSE